MRSHKANMIRFGLLAIVTSAVASGPALFGQPAVYPADRVLTHREQAPLVKSWILKRFDTVLPALMRREKIDMWIIVSREYNDDPVFRSMAPLTTYSSRRRTILVFHDRGGTRRSPVDRPVRLRRSLHGGADRERRAVGRPAQSWSTSAIRKSSASTRPRPGTTPTASRRTRRTTCSRRSARSTRARADRPRCSPSAGSRRRFPRRRQAYRHVMQVAHQVIGEAFSNKVIQPGMTTSEDVVWWMRQRVANMGLGHWFHPSITIHRKGGVAPERRRTRA